MKNIKLLVISLVVLLGLGVNAATQTPLNPLENLQQRQASQQVPQQAVQKTGIKASSLDIVARPNFYLNKYVTVKGKFDKFSTLGLDYKPAMRSSEEYISFLIQRDDIKDHNIPLSEMKIFMKRNVAEKYIELNSGDEVEFSGKVFSTALGDVWMDAEEFKVISSKASVDEAKK